MTATKAIPGWADVVDWFGYSPNFHDAEVVSIDLRRDPNASVVRVHACRTNNDLTASGHFRQDRHALITFTIEGIQSVELIGWNHQNVLSELWVDKSENTFILHLPEINGVDGQIAAKKISISIEPYDP